MTTLVIMPLGNGGGTIVSEPVGIQCPAVCSSQFPVGTQVKLTAVPESGWKFDMWNQACSGTDPACTVVMSDTQNVGFSFTPALSSCTTPQVQCGGQCVDTTTDPSHCGDCNTACGIGESCMAAACMPQPCELPNLKCGAQCVDPTIDSLHCGSCNSACDASHSCVAAACVGTGNLQISATWSRAGDGDLLVTTPNGNTLWWNNLGPNAATDFGHVDRVDTVGTGAENIYWALGVVPPSGLYYVCFETSFFASSPSTAEPVLATVTVRRKSGSQTDKAWFTKTTSFNATCNPGLDTFLTAFTYP